MSKLIELKKELQELRENTLNEFKDMDSLALILTQKKIGQKEMSVWRNWLKQSKKQLKSKMKKKKWKLV